MEFEAVLRIISGRVGKTFWTGGRSWERGGEARFPWSHAATTSSHGLVRSQNSDLLVTVAQLLIEAEAGAVDSHDREVRERNPCC